jgi:hypothetical protein
MGLEPNSIGASDAWVTADLFVTCGSAAIVGYSVAWAIVAARTVGLSLQMYRAQSWFTITIVNVCLLGIAVYQTTRACLVVLAVQIAYAVGNWRTVVSLAASDREWLITLAAVPAAWTITSPIPGHLWAVHIMATLMVLVSVFIYVTLRSSVRVQERRRFERRLERDIQDAMNRDVDRRAPIDARAVALSVPGLPDAVSQIVNSYATEYSWWIQIVRVRTLLLTRGGGADGYSQTEESRVLNMLTSAEDVAEEKRKWSPATSTFAFVLVPPGDPEQKRSDAGSFRATYLEDTRQFAFALRFPAPPATRFFETQAQANAGLRESILCERWSFNVLSKLKHEDPAQWRQHGTAYTVTDKRNFDPEPVYAGAVQLSAVPRTNHDAFPFHKPEWSTTDARYGFGFDASASASPASLSLDLCVSAAPARSDFAVRHSPYRAA